MKNDTLVITAKVQIFPNKQQVLELKQMFELYSLACNWLSKKVFQNLIEYKLTGRIAPLLENESDRTDHNGDIAEHRNRLH